MAATTSRQVNPMRPGRARRGRRRRRPRKKRRLRSLPWDAATDVRKAKRYYGGSFPLVRGRKHTYPRPSDEKGWMRLIRQAVAYDKQRSAAVRSGRPAPACPDQRFAYILFHASPVEKKRRALRGKHRQLHGLKVGDRRHVHHLNPGTMAFSQTVVLTPCQHKRQHGKRCWDPTR
jgi:hypothetical protein